MQKKFVCAVLSLVMVLSLAPISAFAAEEEETKGHLPYAIDEGLQAAIDAVVEPYIQETYNNRAVPGAVVLVAKDGKILAEKAYGYAYLTDPPEEGPYALLAQGARAVNSARNEAKSEESINGKRVEKPVPMTTDTLFDMASLTKVLCTTQAVMKLVSEGKIESVNDTVAKYIPEFAQNGKENVTLAQLLTHTSGISQWEPDYLMFENDRQAVLEFYCTLPLTYPGGKNEENNCGYYAYSDIGFRMLAYVVEAVSGKSIDEYVKTEIYEPLGLTHTTFKPLENGFTADDCAATSWGNMYEMAMVDEDNLPGFSYNTKDYMDGLTKRDAGELGAWRDYTLRGEVNDGNTAMASGGVSGAAGLFSTASDVAVLGQLMLNGGIYNGVRIYDEAVVEDFTAPKLTEEDQGYGFKLWWGWMGDKANNIRLGSTFGHDGFTGTQAWMDKDTGLIVVVLTNKMNVGSGVYEDDGRYYPSYSSTLASGISRKVSDAVFNYFGSFNDVAEDHWAAGAIRFVANRDILQGTGEGAFNPDGKLTRGMMMTTLARMAGQDIVGGDTDYSAGVKWAVAQGISDGTDPAVNVTREQVAVMLYHYAKAETTDGASASFRDADQISDWAREAMDWAVAQGILTGTDGGRLDPQGEATRAEAALMLQRFLYL